MCLICVLIIETCFHRGRLADCARLVFAYIINYSLTDMSVARCRVRVGFSYTSAIILNSIDTLYWSWGARRKYVSLEIVVLYVDMLVWAVGTYIHAAS